MISLNLIADLEKLKNPTKAEIFKRFFKTGKGEYGEGDVFFGLTVPQTQSVVKKYLNLPFPEIQKLLNHKVHECRWAACMILNFQFKKADSKSKEKIADFYLKNARKFNNWDLVDTTAPNILGDYLSPFAENLKLKLEDKREEFSASEGFRSQRSEGRRYPGRKPEGASFNKNKDILYKFAKSKNLWERRIGIMATFGFIRRNQFKDSLKIAEILLNDDHDLIHKAVGWMLREIGKRNIKVEKEFLDKYHKIMPRTMLRYAIEKFSQEERKKYLAR